MPILSRSEDLEPTTSKFVLMDSYYPTERATKDMVEWNNKLSNPDAYLIKTGMAWPAANLDQISVVTIKKMDNGQCAKAMFPSTNGHCQEAVFTVVGVLNQHALPPVHSVTPHRVKFSSQHATVVGFDTEHFQKAIDNLDEIAWAMYCAFGQGTVEPWRPAEPDLYGRSLTSSCRYFTIGNNIPDALKTPFHPKTDPRGVLSEHISDKVSHCFDNDVMYMELKDDKYVDKDPATFKSGDIVEMGFAFVAWRKGKHSDGPEHNCKLVLRTLTFIEGKYTKESFFAKKAALPKVKPYQNGNKTHLDMNPLAKRKLKESADSDDEEASTAKRMHMLTIDAVSLPSSTDQTE
ncbi:hypothetical protein B0H14DRAFT_3874045 [Mycena olivaceomarginata]|nr:hypothetical protein B0H14DRAFT_3874045 [Mycena olivaceomarginata]